MADKRINKAIKKDETQISLLVTEFDNAIDNLINILSIGVGNTEGQSFGVGVTNGIVDEATIESGYYQMINTTINNEYQAILDEEAGLLSDILEKEVIISDSNLERLMQDKELNLQQFNGITRNIQDKLSAEIYNFSRGNITRKQLFENIKEISAQYKVWTKTWVDTAIEGFKRDSFFVIADENGVKEFVYIGPMDSITRPFCRAHVGETRTADEWNTLQGEQNQIAPVMAFGGGYQCRHRFGVVI